MSTNRLKVFHYLATSFSRYQLVASMLIIPPASNDFPSVSSDPFNCRASADTEKHLPPNFSSFLAENALRRCCSGQKQEANEMRAETESP